MSIQALIDAAQPGETVIVPPGIYRERPAVDRAITLDGSRGAEIRGSDVWTAWTPGAGTWTSTNTVPAFTGGGVCDPTSDGRCLWPEQVFYDGTPLQQVASNPTSGQFALDAGRHVVIADTPAGHTVEVTTREAWIEPGAANVTVKGFTMQHAATPPQNGALTNGGYRDWTILRNTLSDAHGANVSLWGASGCRLLGNDISRGGQEGFHAWQLTDALIAGNRFHHNHTEAFDLGWEAGAMKLAECRGVTFRDNESDHNTGDGFWCDIDCTGMTILRNRSHHNSGAGFVYEISHSALFQANASWGNSKGFFISTSDHVTLRDNLVVDNLTKGIFIQADNRGAGYVPTDILIQGNTILASDGDGVNVFGLEWLDNHDGALYLAENTNRGAGNRFWYDTPAGYQSRFAWDGSGYLDIAAFAATQGGVGSAYLPSQWAADSYRYALGIDRTCRTVAMGSSSR